MTFPKYGFQRTTLFSISCGFQNSMFQKVIGRDYIAFSDIQTMADTEPETISKNALKKQQKAEEAAKKKAAKEQEKVAKAATVVTTTKSGNCSVFA